MSREQGFQKWSTASLGYVQIFSEEKTKSEVKKKSATQK